MLAVRRETPAIDVAAISPGERNNEASTAAVTMSRRIERRNPDGRQIECISKSLDRRDPDPESAKRARADGDGERVDILNLSFDAREQNFDGREEIFGMSRACRPEADEPYQLFVLQKSQACMGTGRVYGQYARQHQW